MASEGKEILYESAFVKNSPKLEDIFFIIATCSPFLTILNSISTNFSAEGPQQNPNWQQSLTILF